MTANYINSGWNIDSKIFVVKTIGDGSCFIHSLLTCVDNIFNLGNVPLMNDQNFKQEMLKYLNQNYNSSDYNTKSILALNFRKILLKWLYLPSQYTEMEAQTILNQEPRNISLWFYETFRPNIKIKNRLEIYDAYNIILNPNTVFYQNNNPTQINLQNNDIRDIFNYSIYFEMVKSFLSRNDSWYDNAIIEFVEKNKQRNDVIDRDSFNAQLEEYKQNMLRLKPELPNFINNSDFKPILLHEYEKYRNEYYFKNMFNLPYSVFKNIINSNDEINNIKNLLGSLGLINFILDHYIIEPNYKNKLQKFLQTITYLKNSAEFTIDTYDKYSIQNYTFQQYLDLAKKSIYYKTNLLATEENINLEFYQTNFQERYIYNTPIVSKFNDRGDSTDEIDLNTLNNKININYFMFENGEFLRHLSINVYSLPYLERELPTNNWIGDEIISLIAVVLNLDIYVFSHSNNFLYKYSDFLARTQNSKIIMIYYIQQAHYEAMGADDKLIFDKNDKISQFLLTNNLTRK